MRMVGGRIHGKPGEIVFWENGLPRIAEAQPGLFRLHSAAYADEPGGAAGAAEDAGRRSGAPSFRKQSSSLSEFLKRIAWVTSFQQLQEIGCGRTYPYLAEALF